MSIQSAMAFRDKVKASPELQGELQEKVDNNPAELVKLAAEKGFEFTEVEWYQAMNPNEKSVLGSFDLDRISGRKE